MPIRTLIILTFSGNDAARRCCVWLIHGHTHFPVAFVAFAEGVGHAGSSPLILHHLRQAPNCVELPYYAERNKRR